MSYFDLTMGEQYRKTTTLFGFGLLLMVLHKTESTLQGEFLVDPAYTVIAGLLGDPRNVMIALIITLMLIFVLCFLSMRGGKRQLVVLSIAGLLFTHEIHHLIRSLIGLYYYPGTITGVIMCGFSVYYWKTLFAEHLAHADPAASIEKL